MKVNCSQASQYKQHQIKMLLDLALFEVPLFYELIKKVNHRHGQEKKHESTTRWLLFGYLFLILKDFNQKLLKKEQNKKKSFVSAFLSENQRLKAGKQGGIKPACSSTYGHITLNAF